MLEQREYSRSKFQRRIGFSVWQIVAAGFERGARLPNMYAKQKSRPTRRHECRPGCQPCLHLLTTRGGEATDSLMALLDSRFYACYRCDQGIGAADKRRRASHVESRA